MSRVDLKATAVKMSASTTTSLPGPSTWAWSNKPNVEAIVGQDAVKLQTENGTDAWSNTYYGFPDPQPHNMHFLYSEVSGQAVLEATVKVYPTPLTGRYDQAGVMVRVSRDCWLKASVEYIPDAPSHLGSVTTNAGWSDWATQDIAPLSVPSPTGGPEGVVPCTWAQYRLHRLRGGDYVLEGRLLGVDGQPSGPFSQLRMCHLHSDPDSPRKGTSEPITTAFSAGAGAGAEDVQVTPGTVQMGVYACSPLGPGCAVEISGISLVAGRTFKEPSA